MGNGQCCAGSWFGRGCDPDCQDSFPQGDDGSMCDPEVCCGTCN